MPSHIPSSQVAMNPGIFGSTVAFTLQESVDGVPSYQVQCVSAFFQGDLGARLDCEAHALFYLMQDIKNIVCLRIIPPRTDRMCGPPLSKCDKASAGCGGCTSETST